MLILTYLAFRLLAIFRLSRLWMVLQLITSITLLVLLLISISITLVLSLYTCNEHC